jgi:hypothetical protein
MEIAVQLIQQLGFPIFVSVYLLHIHSKKLDAFHVTQTRTNVLLAVLVRVLTADTEIAIPDEVVDEVSGVMDVPE